MSTPTQGCWKSRCPRALASYTNADGRRRNRFRLERPLRFVHLSEEWEHRARSNVALTYELSYRFPVRNRAGGWYLKCSWSLAAVERPSLYSLRQHNTLAVDLNSDHLACWVIDPQGNPVGEPFGIEILRDTDNKRYTTGQKDADIRSAIQQLLEKADLFVCASISIENLNFAKNRKIGKTSHKTSKRFRRIVCGMPTAKFRDRLVAMAYNRDRPIWVIAVDPGVHVGVGQVALVAAATTDLL